MKITHASRVILANPKNGKLTVLLSKDGNPCIPGGRKEYGESREMTAVRELLEEAGIMALNLFKVNGPFNLPEYMKRIDVCQNFLCTKWIKIRQSERPVVEISCDEYKDHHIARIGNIWVGPYWPAYSKMQVWMIDWIQSNNIKDCKNVIPRRYLLEKIVIPTYAECSKDWICKGIKNVQSKVRDIFTLYGCHC